MWRVLAITVELFMWKECDHVNKAKSKVLQLDQGSLLYQYSCRMKGFRDALPRRALEYWRMNSWT